MTLINKTVQVSSVQPNETSPASRFVCSPPKVLIFLTFLKLIEKIVAINLESGAKPCLMVTPGIPDTDYDKW